MPAASYALHCAPAADGVAVAPCGVVEGVALSPHLVPATSSAISYDNAGVIFGFAVSVVLVCYVTGYTVGAIVRVVRSA